MPRIKSKTLKLLSDDRVIEIKNSAKRNFQLNKALRDPKQFKKFAANPRKFAEDFDFEIDTEISDLLSLRLKDFNSLVELKALGGFDPVGPVGATVWAVAKGAYSVSTSKVAVAF